MGKPLAGRVCRLVIDWRTRTMMTKCAYTQLFAAPWPWRHISGFTASPCLAFRQNRLSPNPNVLKRGIFGAIHKTLAKGLWWQREATANRSKLHPPTLTPV